MENAGDLVAWNPKKKQQGSNTERSRGDVPGDTKKAPFGVSDFNFMNRKICKAIKNCLNIYTISYSTKFKMIH